MPSAFIPSDLLLGRRLGSLTGTPAVRPSRSSRVLATALSDILRPRRIGTELSHDVLNSSSRTAFNGEQPNPWDPLQPQDAMS